MRLLANITRAWAPWAVAVGIFAAACSLWAQSPTRGDLEGRLADIGDRVSPLNAADVFTSTVMPGSRGTFFVYFPTKSVSSPVLHLKVGGIELGGFGDELIFMYRFEVQE